MAPLAAPVKTLTFAISPKWPGDSLNQRGFTLIELLVVLAIGAMLIGLVPVAFGKMHEGSQYRDTVRGIVTQLRQARQQAFSRGHQVVFQIDLNKRQFGIQGQPQQSLPTTLEAKTTVANLADSSTTGVASIVFLPEGGSTGGTIELVRASGAGVRIRVDWLMGQVAQEPLAL